MRGSLVHDALYQLMREDHLDHTKYRAAADQLLHDICMEDGMPAVRAWWVYEGVSRFGEPSSDPASTKPVLIAPRVDPIENYERGQDGNRSTDAILNGSN